MGGVMVGSLGVGGEVGGGGVVAWWWVEVE